MNVDVILCNSAEVADGKLYVIGGAITMIQAGTVAPPYPVSLALGIVVHVPYTSTNQAHTLSIDLLDDDENHIAPWAPEGMESPDPLRVEAQFNLGRSPLLLPGETQSLPFAINIPGLPLGSQGSYSLRTSIDGSEVHRAHFRVLAQTQQLGMGPTAIPRLPGN